MRDVNDRRETSLKSYLSQKVSSLAGTSCSIRLKADGISMTDIDDRREAHIVQHVPVRLVVV
jgi:hypothetical protein